jgi:hypothetical protein
MKTVGAEQTSRTRPYDEHVMMLIFHRVKVVKTVNRIARPHKSLLSRH